MAERWTDDERQRLRELRERGATVSEIGARLGRSGAAVRSQCRALGIASPLSPPGWGMGEAKSRLGQTQLGAAQAAAPRLRLEQLPDDLLEAAETAYADYLAEREAHASWARSCAEQCHGALEAEDQQLVHDGDLISARN